MPNFSHRDLNRQKKVYPYSRQPKKFITQTINGADVQVLSESLTTPLTGEMTTISFSEQFTEIPKVVATVSASSDYPTPNISISSVTTEQVVIVSSTDAIGLDVAIHALQDITSDGTKDVDVSITRYTYPLARLFKRLSADLSEKNNILQHGSAIFAGVSSEQIIAFPTEMSTIPVVLVTPLSTNADVVLVITDVTKTGFKVVASTNFTGEINWHAYGVGE